MLTVACVYVQGNVPYTDEYVHRLKSMVERNLNQRHRFVCLSDRGVPGVDVVRIKSPDGIPGWWSKIELFNPQHQLTGRVLYLDLDVLVTGPLDGIADYDAKFALVPDGGTFKGRGGLSVVKRYNSSVMVWDNRASVNRLYQLWNPSVARRLWGDQDYIGQMLPNEQVMPLMWFPRLSEVPTEFASVEDAKQFFAEAGTRVVLSKKPKNAEAAVKWQWFREMWQ
jgi:hypothetical protein